MLYFVVVLHLADCSLVALHAVFMFDVRCIQKVLTVLHNKVLY